MKLIDYIRLEGRGGGGGRNRGKVGRNWENLIISNRGWEEKKRVFSDKSRKRDRVFSFFKIYSDMQKCETLYKAYVIRQIPYCWNFQSTEGYIILQ